SSSFTACSKLGIRIASLNATTAFTLPVSVLNLSSTGTVSSPFLNLDPTVEEFVPEGRSSLLILVLRNYVKYGPYDMKRFCRHLIACSEGRMRRVYHDSWDRKVKPCLVKVVGSVGIS